ncbi:MAG TPA: DUF5700 domain-containing putative Zn-dependent protease [Terriglobales bacterium]|nr:DUF5700 domain-containing putative Zn-dependent protease [Terriglobales bacterium]
MKRLAPRLIQLATLVLFMALPLTAVCSSFLTGRTTRPARSDFQHAVDGTGVRAFWPVMEALQRDREPSDDAWGALFATPGYAKLQPAYVKRTLRLAYMPAKSEELRTALHQGDYYSRVLTHLVRVPEERERILHFLSSFNAAKTLGAARQEAAAYLPKGATDARRLPLVAFVIVEPDGHVDDDVVVFDVLYAIDRGADFVDILAHEFHHYYEPSRLQAPPADSADYYIVHTVKQVQMEGTADLIDKKAYPLHADPQRQWYVDQYNAAYADAPNTLRHLDELLSAAASAQERAVAGKQFWGALKFAGHPTGFYMANTILKYLGKPALIAAEPDPFEFFSVYNDAAKRCTTECYVLSDSSMAALAKLESEYIR